MNDDKSKSEHKGLFFDKLQDHIDKNGYWYFIIFEILFYSVTKEIKSLFFGVLIFPFIYLSFSLLILFLRYLFTSDSFIEKIIMCVFCILGLMELYPFIQLLIGIVIKFFDL